MMLKSIYTYCIILLLTMLGCENTDLPEPTFDTKYSGYPDIPVEYDPDVYAKYNLEWSFGDGEISTESQPSHIFKLNGVYYGTLKVIQKNGEILEVINFETNIQDIQYPDARILQSEEIQEVAKSIKFEAAIDAPSYQVDYFWDFGDGNTSTNNYKYHSYDNAGIYSVMLTVTNAIGESTTDTTEVYIYDKSTINLIAKDIYGPDNPTVLYALIYDNISDIPFDHANLSDSAYAWGCILIDGVPPAYKSFLAIDVDGEIVNGDNEGIFSFDLVPLQDYYIMVYNLDVYGYYSSINQIIEVKNLSIGADTTINVDVDYYDW